MNKSDAVDIVAYRLGNRTDLDTRIGQEMSLVQETRLERSELPLPWFLLTENAYIDTVASEQRLPVPSNFLREYENGALWYYVSGADVEWTMLCKDSEQILRAALGDTLSATGKPSHYSLTGDYFRLYPVPDAVYRIYMKYYAQDTLITAVSDTAENSWLKYAPDLLISETLLKMSRQLRMRPQAVQEFEKDVADARRRFLVDVEARKHTNRRYIMGGATWG